MSKTKPSALEVVERYHTRYLEYKAAFESDPSLKGNPEVEIKKVLDSGIELESDDFFDKMADIIIERNMKSADLNSASIRFMLFVEFYLLTEEEELPAEILKDYDNLPPMLRDSVKQYNSVDGGKFVRNEERELTPEMKAYIDAVVSSLK